MRISVYPEAPRNKNGEDLLAEDLPQELRQSFQKRAAANGPQDDVSDAKIRYWACRFYTDRMMGVTVRIGGEDEDRRI